MSRAAFALPLPVAHVSIQYSHTCARERRQLGVSRAHTGVQVQALATGKAGDDLPVAPRRKRTSRRRPEKNGGDALATGPRGTASSGPADSPTQPDPPAQPGPSAIEDISSIKSGPPDFMQLILSMARDGFETNGDARDFLQELLPLLAKREAQEAAELAGSEELALDKKLQMLASTVRNQDLSMHRSSGSYDALLPFKLRDQENVSCAQCSGTGMATCEFCHGEGFVSADVCGEPGSIIEFNGSTAVVPDVNDVLDICLCPFCGGITKERCIVCGGEGIVRKDDAFSPAHNESPPKVRKKRGVAGASTYCSGEPAFEEANREKYIEKHRDRIEIGLDGTVILRAKTTGPKKSKRSRKKPKGKAEEKVVKDLEPSERPQGKRRRGRPRKGESPEDEMRPLSDGDARLWAMRNRSSVGMGPGSRVVSGTVGGMKARRSTDFVNTTAYQFIRKDGPRTSASSAASFSEELDMQQQLADSSDPNTSSEDEVSAGELSDE